MIKNKTILEILKGEKTFQLSLDPNSTLGEVFDVLTEMRAFIVERINEAAKPEANKDKPQAVEVPKEFTE